MNVRLGIAALLALLAPLACSSSATEDYGIILGTVTDTGGSFLGEVTVTAGDQVARSNSQGYFSISNISATDRLVVTFEKKDYVMTAEVVTIRKSQSNFIQAVMAHMAAPQTLDATAGGTLTFAGGATITIPPSSLTTASGSTFTGTANVALTTFDPTTPAGQAAFPGEFAGVDKDGKEIPIVSFGFLDISVTDAAGAALQLASGKTATLAIPYPSSLESVAPTPTIPFWYFNPSDGKWHEESVGTKGTGVYSGTIPHFSIWNNDVGYNRSYVKGRVVDCATREPVECARVAARGISPRNCWTSGETCTPSDGTFTIPVDADSTFDLTISKNGTSTQPQVLHAAASEGTLDVGDICIGTPKITIVTTWGVDPSDLDTHLTFPLLNPPDGRDHIYFGNKQASDGSANLDTDDTSGFGPEITSVYTLHDGVYRFSIHQFSGSGTICTSQVNIDMVIDGKGIYNRTAPSLGCNGQGDAWAVWDLVIADGKVSDIRDLGTIKPSISSGDIDAFSPPK